MHDQILTLILQSVWRIFKEVVGSSGLVRCITQQHKNFTTGFGEVKMEKWVDLRNRRQINGVCENLFMETNGKGISESLLCDSGVDTTEEDQREL